MDSKKLVSSYINHTDWRVNENANAGFSYASLLNHVSGAVIADYTLNEVYPKHIADAHINGDLHLHDLSCGIVAYCFTGDTKIKLLNGTTRTLKEIADEGSTSFWVYSKDDRGNTVPGKAHSARITRRNAELVQVTLDNNEEIRCTPDHPFMLRDGSYKPASELKAGDSLADDLLLPTEDSNNSSDCSSNHKVLDVVRLGYTEDVYDITVDKYHNFLLDAGVYVHNCAGWSLRDLLERGFQGKGGRASAAPAKHLDTILGQIVNFLCTLQTEWA